MLPRTALAGLACLALALATSAPGQRVLRNFTVTNATGGIRFDPVSRELYVVVLGDRVRVIPVDGGPSREVRLPPAPRSGGTSVSASDLCIDPLSANLWVGDGRGFVYEVDPQGNGTGRGFLTQPSLTAVATVAWDPDARQILAAQAGTGRVVRFTESGAVAQVVDLAIGEDRIKRLDWDPAQREFVVAYTDVTTVARFRADGTLSTTIALRPIDVWPTGICIDRSAGSAFIVDDRINTGRVHEVSAVPTPIASDALRRHGAGCALPGGAVPRLAITAPAVAGGSTIFAVSKPAEAFAVLLFGIAPLTMNLDFLGAPACDLWTAPWVTIVPDSGPPARRAVLLPVPPAAVGRELEMQAFVSAGGSVATSDAATLRVERRS